MADNYLQDVFARLFAMQIEAMAAISKDVDTLYWPNQQNDFPYITTRLATMTVDTDTFSEEVEAYNHTVLMRLVVGHFTEGYEGEPQDKALQYIVALEDYFREHENLTTDAGSYTSEPDYLLVANTNVLQAPLSGHTGLIAFNNGGIGQIQLGCEFTLNLAFLRDVCSS
jgi:hypothetical protein